MAEYVPTVQATLLCNLLRVYVAGTLLVELAASYHRVSDEEYGWAMAVLHSLLGPDVYTRQACTRTYMN